MVGRRKSIRTPAYDLRPNTYVLSYHLRPTTYVLSSDGTRLAVALGAMHDRRRGDRRNRLLAILFLLTWFYVGLFVWPTPWRYDRVGNTPVRTNRVTGEVEYLNLQGWQPALPPLDVHRDLETAASRSATPPAAP